MFNKAVNNASNTI